jgi:probable F420-dependent oxidoreductase
MKVGTGIGGPLSGVPSRAKRAEAAGYDYLSCGELAHDSMLTMCLAAAATERSELMTSVTICFPRAPMILAMEAWDIQALSRGRFILGLGSQVKGHNERRFSTPWSAPAPRMKEYIETLRAIWTTFADPSQRPDYMGQHYQYRLMTPNFNPGPIDAQRPKVFMAVVGPAMARVAGALADGVIPHGFTTDKYLRHVLLPNVAIGLARAGRSWDDIEICGGGMTVFGEDEADIERQLDRLRQPISFYGSTRSYHDVFAIHGWQDLGEQLHALSLRGEWQKMREIIPEHVLRGFAQTATYEKLPHFIAEQREYATRMTLPLPGETPAQRERSRGLLQEIQALQTPRVPRGLPATS